MEHVKGFKAGMQCFLNYCFSNKFMRAETAFVCVRTLEIKPGTIGSRWGCFLKEIGKETAECLF